MTIEQCGNVSEGTEGVVLMRSFVLRSDLRE